MGGLRVAFWANCILGCTQFKIQGEFDFSEGRTFHFARKKNIYYPRSWNTRPWSAEMVCGDALSAFWGKEAQEHIAKKWPFWVNRLVNAVGTTRVGTPLNRCAPPGQLAREWARDGFLRVCGP
jgi:hypothetical protein